MNFRWGVCGRRVLTRVYQRSFRQIILLQFSIYLTNTLEEIVVGFSLWKGSKSGLALLTPVVDFSTWEVGFEFEDFPGIALATTVSGGGLSLEFSTWEVYFDAKNPIDFALTIPGCGDRFGFATVLAAVA